MTEAQEQKLNEVHEMLSFFSKVYDEQFSEKEFSPDPTNTVTCQKRLD